MEAQERQGSSVGISCGLEWEWSGPGTRLPVSSQLPTHSSFISVSYDRRPKRLHKTFSEHRFLALPHQHAHESQTKLTEKKEIAQGEILNL